MKTYIDLKSLIMFPSEKASSRILMERMGLNQKELEQIFLLYGVSAAEILQRMELSKYRFVRAKRKPGLCEPCNQHPFSFTQGLEDRDM